MIEYFGETGLAVNDPVNSENWNTADHCPWCGEIISLLPGVWTKKIECCNCGMRSKVIRYYPLRLRRL